MGFLIDTTVLIQAFRTRLALGEVLKPYAESPTFLSVITVSELLHGTYRAASPEAQVRRSGFAEGVITAFPILDVTLATARIHARIGATLVMQGYQIGVSDLWIAALALQHNLAVLTMNTRHFRYVSGLEVMAP
jgi:predicted nucleic acid-binding protein